MSLFPCHLEYSAVRASGSVESCADNTPIKLFALTNMIRNKRVGTENRSLCKICRHCYVSDRREGTRQEEKQVKNDLQEPLET